MANVLHNNALDKVTLFFFWYHLISHSYSRTEILVKDVGWDGTLKLTDQKVIIIIIRFLIVSHKAFGKFMAGHCTVCYLGYPCHFQLSKLFSDFCSY